MVPIDNHKFDQGPKFNYNNAPWAEFNIPHLVPGSGPSRYSQAGIKKLFFNNEFVPRIFGDKLTSCFQRVRSIS